MLASTSKPPTSAEVDALTESKLGAKPAARVDGNTEFDLASREN